MARSLVRRPLPALIALFALLLLTALVWWRVLHRDDSNTAAQPNCPTPTPTGAPTRTLPVPSTVTLQVLNGTYKLKKARSGIAGKVATKLIKDGFKVPDVAADDKKHKVTTVAEIRYGPKGRSAATLLDYYFDQKAKLVPTPKEKSATVTVSLGQGYKSLVRKAQVRRALATDHITLTDPTKHGPSPAGSCAPSTAGSAAPSATKSAATSPTTPAS